MNPIAVVPAPGSPGEQPSVRPQPGFAYYARKAARALSSLQLTVVLLGLSLGLVFLGTLAQKTSGLWTVVDRYFWSWVVMIDFQPLLEFGKIFFGLPKTWQAPSWAMFPYPGAKLIGGLMFINLLAAHATRFRLTWKRLGVLAAHSGILLLFVGEAITRECQVEQRMTIREGESVNFTEDHRECELVVTTQENDQTDRVTVIPGALLARAARSHETIAHPDLPFDVRVDSYMPNADMFTTAELATLQAEGKPVPENPATKGLGLTHVARAKAEGAGVGDQQIPDMPTTYVTLLQKGSDRPIGTYLLSLWFTPDTFNPNRTPPQVAEVGGTKHLVTLRHTRYYKEFSLYLIKFSFDRYPGTEAAKNYSSDLRLIDPERGQNREVHIAMNEPLRYRGETFYQLNFDKTTEKATVLQVVRNPGWLLPYVSCALVSLGLGAHFLLMLTRFLVKSKAPSVPNDVDLWGLIAALYVVVVLILRFGLLGRALDPILGSIGSGTGPDAGLFGSLATLFAYAAIPFIGFYVLIRRFRPAGSARPKPEGMTQFERLLPWGIAGLSALFLLGQAVPKPPEGKMDLAAAARIPVVDGGRVKPLDTVARVYLRKISGQEELSENGRTYPAIRWLMDTMASSPTGTGAAWKYRVVRIENDQVLDLLGLKRRFGYRYSLEEIRPQFAELGRAADILNPEPGSKPEKDPKIERLFESGDRDVFAAQIQETASRIKLYLQVMRHEAPLVLPSAETGNWISIPKLEKQIQIDAMMDAFKSRGIMPRDAETLSEQDQESIKKEIDQKVSAEMAAYPGALRFVDMLAAYRASEPAQFSAELDAFRQATSPAIGPGAIARVQFEVYLNEFAPTYYMLYLYFVAGVLALASWVGMLFRPALGESLRRSAFWMLLILFVTHGFALAARMYLMDRPFVFVTNLYSTAVFIGWAAVGLGLILERVFPIGLGTFLAATVGGITGIIAHNLAASGDTLEMMQAVLDTNFWLATHVTTINLGYSATYVAGVSGIVYIALGLFTRVLDQPAWIHSTGARPDTTIGKALGQLMYGVICLATLTSFVGTVLGGIWADQSWGRFWGWDPKENGAILIVIWNALILHARWCGLVKDRGTAVLALVGNMVTTWSYFGTNQLGVGLHAYGFSNALATGCVVTWLAHAVMIGIGLIPTPFWTSTGTLAPVVQAPADSRGERPRNRPPTSRRR